MTTEDAWDVDPLARPYPLLGLGALGRMTLPPVRWAVDGIIPYGALTIISGREKSGKSLLMLDALASISGGEPFLDRATEQGAGLYVAAEENIRDVRDRIQMRLGPRYADDTRPLFVLPLQTIFPGAEEPVTIRLDDPESVARLEATIAAHEIGVVTLDPFRELHNFSENDSDAMAPILAPLRAMAHRLDVAVIVIHHDSRHGSFRGSTAIGAAADQLIHLRKPAGSDDDDAITGGTLRVVGRYGPPQTIATELGPGLRWQVATVDVTHDDANSRGRILTALTTAPDEGMTADEIAAQIGASRKTAQNTLATLLRESIPKVEAVGTGRRGDPYRYRLRAGVGVTPSGVDTPAIRPELVPARRDETDPTPENPSNHAGKYVPKIRPDGNPRGRDVGTKRQEGFVRDESHFVRDETPDEEDFSPFRPELVPTVWDETEGLPENPSDCAGFFVPKIRPDDTPCVWDERTNPANPRPTDDDGWEDI